jgi:hypothetical protein
MTSKGHYILLFSLAVLKCVLSQSTNRLLSIRRKIVAHKHFQSRRMAGDTRRTEIRSESRRVSERQAAKQTYILQLTDERQPIQRYWALLTQLGFDIARRQRASPTVGCASTPQVVGCRLSGFDGTDPRQSAAFWQREPAAILTRSRIAQTSVLAPNHL